MTAAPSQMLRILAFDTSCQVTSVAVCVGEQVRAADHTPSDARHAETLLPKIRACLASADLTLADIDVIGVGVGPGSFTGVRVGIATAKGLGLALQRPVLPVISLDALAHAALAHTSRGLLAACLDAYKGELFAALFRRSARGLAPVLGPFHDRPQQLAARLAAASGDEPLALVGAGVARYPEFLGHLPAHVECLDEALGAPQAHVIATLAREAFERGEVPELGRIVPVYLRDSDAQLPKTPLRV